MNDLNKSIPEIGLYAFWDIDKTKLNFSQDKDFILSRMVERGTLDDVLKTLSFYGIREAKRVLTSNKYLSREAMYLAHLLLNTPIENFSAFAASNHLIRESPWVIEALLDYLPTYLCKKI
jgi:hypothetical protein